MVIVILHQICYMVREKFQWLTALHTAQYCVHSSKCHTESKVNSDVYITCFIHHTTSLDWFCFTCWCGILVTVVTNWSWVHSIKVKRLPNRLWLDNVHLMVLYVSMFWMYTNLIYTHTQQTKLSKQDQQLLWLCHWKPTVVQCEYIKICFITMRFIF